MVSLYSGSLTSFGLVHLLWFIRYPLDDMARCSRAAYGVDVLSGTSYGELFADAPTSHGGASEGMESPAGCAAWTASDVGDVYVKVLPAHVVVVRLQLAMLPLSMHALLKRLLFCSGPGRHHGRARAEIRCARS